MEFVSTTQARGSPTRQAGAGHGAGSLAGACLEVISFGESAVADEGAGDGGEGQEVLSLAFVA
ncbi:hypothetical protein, partial [Streptomyces hydrogenans]|uniref:hypothetical protein n=1 Tax=Streptomyces hydrogenans TaxID=1873719 RepID=UPI0038082864